VSTTAVDQSTDQDGQHRKIIARRTRELAELCEQNSRRLRQKAGTWRIIGVSTSLIAAGLAASAGATGLSDVLSKEAIAYLAISSAVLTAINSGLGATSTAETEQKAAHDFFELQTDADDWRELRLAGESTPDAVGKLDAFVKRRNEILAVTAASIYYLTKRDARDVGGASSGNAQEGARSSG
jgi:hypothetical protein